MRKVSKIAVVLLMISFFINKANAQVDPHYSQYYVYPSWLNPALTGVFDGDYRISGIYRNQWSNISPFNTPGITVDFAGNKNLNYGLSIMNQTAGGGGYNYLTAYGSLAYTGLKFGTDGTQRFVFGMQAGIINRKFNKDKLSFGDQWNSSPVPLPTKDQITKPSSMDFDMGAGILYYDAKPNRKANFYAGFSASHLTRPDDDFGVYNSSSTTGSTVQSKVPVRYTVHAGVKIKVNETVSVTPNALYLQQGEATEKMLGAYVQMRAMENTDFLVGANYRFKDAIVPYVGFYYKSITLGLSYDVNTSDLGRAASGANSFEISLSFIGKKSAKTPEHEFVCPRL